MSGGLNAAQMGQQMPGNFQFGFPGAAAYGGFQPTAFGFDGANAFNPGAQQPAAGSQQRPENDDKVPPAGAKALRQLPQVVVSQEDLEDDETNAECAICLRDQALGDTVSKLPCGHIFCTSCVTDWLKRNCTCPVCRYELETDSSKFEAGRKERMACRKGRYRLRELRAMPPGQLSALVRSLGITAEGGISKDELVQKLVDSGKIEIMPSGPAPTYSKAQLRQMSIGDLKKLMKSLGVLPPEEAIEKDDFVHALSISGRIELSDDADQDASQPAGYGNCRAENYTNFQFSDSNDAAQSSTAMDVDTEPKACNAQVAAEAELDKDALQKRSVGELKKMLKDRGLSLQGCLEKADMVQRILEARR
eukprot:gnl/MRDRNA2_/MRDRNA2_194751_c0_seq1.p1 gnl/MRDRNA2_/MRDRNA2_194751_c0~~gnl/MRDRNA2_/MRDRNA2_194751_c0_seq1.p1  ORF type:complete len:363 (+),score=94.40 gnl/MRDRNA2_/MRDRNA2_194751_c0_seq1:1-1089(+)